MRRTALLLTLAGTILIAAPAGARAGWKTDRALAIWNTVWDHPCNGQTRIQLSAPLADDPGTPVDESTGAEWVYPGTCVIHLRAERNLSWERFCTYVGHGMGHVAGAPHSPNPRSIMFDTQIFGDVRVRHGKGWRQRFYVDRRCQNRGRDFPVITRS